MPERRLFLLAAKVAHLQATLPVETNVFHNYQLPVQHARLKRQAGQDGYCSLVHNHVPMIVVLRFRIFQRGGDGRIRTYDRVSQGKTTSPYDLLQVTIVQVSTACWLSLYC